MVKVRKKGKLPPPRPQWGLGRRILCYWCDCVFVLEEGDDFSFHLDVVLAALRGDSGVVLECSCPTCGAKLEMCHKEVRAIDAELRAGENSGLLR